LTIFCEKIGVFLKNQCYDQILAYFISVLRQKRHFRQKIVENIFKIITSVPDGSGRGVVDAVDVLAVDEGGQLVDVPTLAAGLQKCGTNSIVKHL
jgi:hypothetical protein